MAQPIVTDGSTAARKWAQRVAVSSEDYKVGAVAAANRWQTAAAASDANWKAGVNDAMSKGRFAKGVQTAGAAAYAKGVTDKGGDRFGPGAMAAEGTYTTAITPVLNVIKSVNMPERGPKGSEGNYGRSAAVGKALRQWAQAR